MKKDSNFNVELTIFGINFAFIPIFSIIINFITASSNSSSDYGEDNDLDNEILKISRASGKFHLKYSWSNVNAANIYTDSGTYSNPNNIEDLELNHGGAFL